MRTRTLLLCWGLLVGWMIGCHAMPVIDQSIAFTDRVTAIAVDHAGLVWVGTPGGIVRWNPADATHTHWTAADGLLDNLISDIVVAPSGRVWVAMATWLGGIATLKDGDWITFDERDNLSSDNVYDLAVDASGNLWAATARGLCVISPTPGSSEVLFDAEITRLSWDGDSAVSRPQGVSVDGAGRIWIWQTWGNLVVLDPRGTPHDPADDLWNVYVAEDLTQGQAIASVVPDPWGSVWISFRSGGAVVLDDAATPESNDDALAFYLSNAGFPDSPASVFAFDAAGGLWIPSARRTVHTLQGADTPFDQSDDLWSEIPVPRSIRSWSPSHLAFAPNGDLWLVAGDETGVSRVRLSDPSDDAAADAVWEHYTPDCPLLSNDIRAFAFTGANTWVAADAGVSVLDADGCWNDALHASIYDLASDGQTVWVGSYSGLQALEMSEDGPISTDYKLAERLPANGVRAVAVDPTGLIWCGLPDAGVFVLDPNGTPHDPLDDRSVLFTTGPPAAATYSSCIAFEGAHRVWFALGDEGALALDHAGTLGDPSDDVWMRYDHTSGMPSGGTYAALSMPGSGVWLGGCSSLVAVNTGQDFADYQDDRITFTYQPNCAPGLAADAEGILWLAHGWDGIRRFDSAGTPHITEDDAWNAIRTADGLLDNRTNTVAVGPDGRIWVGTDAGITVLRWIESEG